MRQFGEAQLADFLGILFGRREIMPRQLRTADPRQCLDILRRRSRRGAILIQRLLGGGEIARRERPPSRN